MVDRVEVHRYLHKNQRADEDPATEGALAKVGSVMGADAILWGKVSVDQAVANVDISMRDASGKELSQARCVEKLDGGLQADLQVGCPARSRWGSKRSIAMARSESWGLQDWRTSLMLCGTVELHRRAETWRNFCLIRI